MSSPGVYPARLMASVISSSAARLLGRFGAKPPSSPRPVDRVGVGAAVEDVHQRNRQDVAVRAAQVLEQRQVRAHCGGIGHCQRDAQDGVGAELGLVAGAVQVKHGLVDGALVGGVKALQLVSANRR